MPKDKPPIKKGSLDPKKKGKIEYGSAKKWVQDTEAGFKPTAFKVPNGMKTFKFRADKTYRLDFLPYRVGQGNPRCDEGGVHFERTYYVHNDVGPRKERYPCLLRNWNERCPVCDHVAKLYRQGRMDPKEIRKLEPKMRHLWLVKDLDAPQDGYQLFETGHHKTFGGTLQNRLEALPDDSPNLDFFKLDDGMTLLIRSKPATFESRTYHEATNIDFERRRKDYDEDVLDELPCLDDLLVKLSYEELKEKFLGGGADDEESDEDEDSDDTEDDEDEEEKPAKKKGKKAPEPEEEEDEEDEEEDTDEDDDEDDADPDAIEVGDVVKTTSKYKGKVRQGRVTKVDEARGVVTFTDEEDGKIRAFKPDELEVVSKAGADEDEDEEEDEEEEEAPPPKKGKKAKVEEPEEEDEEDSDDTEDDEEEEPPAKKKGGKPAKKSKKDEEEDDEDEDPFEEDDDSPFDDEDEEEDEEEEEAPPPKKKRK